MKKALLYSTATCLISWAAFIIFYLTTKEPSSYQIFAMFYMFIPMIVAMLLQRFKYKEPFTSTDFLHTRAKTSWLTGWLIMPLTIAFAILLSTISKGITFSWGMEDVLGAMPRPVFYILTTLSAMIAGATINALFAFGEEYGWRNYLLAAMKNFSFGKVCLFIGAVWGIWHFPLILMGHNYSTSPVWGVPMMILFCLALTPIITYFTIKGRSVIVAAVMHGTLNALAGYELILLRGGNSFTKGITGFPGIAAMILITLCLFLYDKYVAKENIFTATIADSMAAMKAKSAPKKS